MRPIDNAIVIVERHPKVTSACHVYRRSMHAKALSDAGGATQTQSRYKLLWNEKDAHKDAAETKLL